MLVFRVVPSTFWFGRDLDPPLRNKCRSASIRRDLRKSPDTTKTNKGEAETNAGRRRMNETEGVWYIQYIYIIKYIIYHTCTSCKLASLWWETKTGVILLMEENLHQLICSLSHYLQGFIHPNGGCLGFLIHQQYLHFFSSSFSGHRFFVWLLEKLTAKTWSLLIWLVVEPIHFEKIFWWNWIISPGIGVNIKNSSKPPPSHLF